MFFVALAKVKLKIENNVNYEKKVLQNGYKYPKNNVIELIYSFINAFCEILCFKNETGRCHFDEIGHENCFTGKTFVFVNYEKKELQNGYNFTNAYCEILCFKNEIGRENCFTGKMCY